MAKPSLSSLTRRQFWPTAVGMFSLLVGCNRRQAVTESVSDSLSPSESRPITHALGTTRVPRSPQRIVALSGISELEALLVLGVKPFAAAGDDRSFGRIVWQPHVEDQMEGVEMLPSRRNISLEKLVTLQPDLIIGSASWLRQIYPQLGQIAPTVAIDNIQPWQDNLRLVAEVVGKTEQAEAWITAFEEQVAILIETYLEAIAGITFTTAFYQPAQRQFRVIVGHELDQVFQQIGFTKPPEQSTIGQVMGDALRIANISLERLDLIDTDILFIYSYDYNTIQKAHELPESNRFLEAEPLLRHLQAVKNRRVFIVPGHYWFLGRSMGIPMAVDDLATSVLPSIMQQNLG